MPGHWHNGGVHDVSTTGLPFLLFKVSIKLLEACFEYPCLSELFSEQCHSGCIKHGMHHPPAHKLLERASIMDLQLQFPIAQVV